MIISAKHPIHNVWVTLEGVVFKNGKRAKLSTRPDGYKVVSVGGRGAPVLRVHKLVMETFIGAVKKSKPVVRHLDGSRDNNHLDNLKYGTHAENCKDAIDHGRHFPPPIRCGSSNHFYRGVMHSKGMTKAVQNYLSGSLSSRQAATKFGVSRSHLLRCARKEIAKEVGGS